MNKYSRSCHVGELRYLDDFPKQRISPLVKDVPDGLKIGQNHTLDRTQVIDLIAKLQKWVTDGFLP
jgi:hypothetical protein